MKLTVALIASLVTGAFALRKEIRVSEVKADSKFGMDLLSKSRRVEDGEQNADDDTWIAGMALKFQGCHHVVQWNQEAEDEIENRVETKRLARFRLCPAGSCSNILSAGCNAGYGDYILDLDDFLASYVENKQDEEEEACETYRETYCFCDEDGGEEGEERDDLFDPDICEYQCFQKAGMNECIDYYHDNNNYNNNNNWYNYNNNAEGEEEEEEQLEQIDLTDYTECAQYEGVEGAYYGTNYENNRWYNNNNNNNNNAEGEENQGNYNYDDGNYYIGPYCSDDGGGIVLGMFVDEFCTVFADEYGGVRAYKALSGGLDLPHSSSTDSIVDFSCKSCQKVDEEEEAEEGAERRLEDMNGAEAKEVCTNMYEVAVKCEQNLWGYDVDQDSKSCRYIESIKNMSKTGFFSNHQATPHTVASAFIGIFSASCVGLGTYVHYLKTKLDRGSIDIH